MSSTIWGPMCGTSDPEWFKHFPSDPTRICVKLAGHEGPHLAHRYTFEAVMVSDYGLAIEKAMLSGMNGIVTGISP